MNSDPYILAARIFQILAVLFAVAGIGGLLWLVIIECVRAQRLSAALDEQIQKRPCSVCGRPVRDCREHLATDPDQATLHAREWRRHFDAHCAINPTFPQS